MSRQEFMEQLERLLTDIPEEERTEALTYYNGYFEDAGAENEANIIRELESPEKVAAIIKADIGAEETKVYTEAGYEDVRFRQKEEVGQYTEAAGQKRPQKRSSTEIVLLVLLAWGMDKLLHFPVWSMYLLLPVLLALLLPPLIALIKRTPVLRTLILGEK